jgi:hypothetical protein
MIRTLRGQFEENVPKRLILDDGLLNQGFIVRKFVVCGDPDSSSNDCSAFLQTGITPNKWNWGDNRQIAWASTNVSSLQGIDAPFSVIDPEHIVLQDLFINGRFATAGIVGNINYLIELEPKTLTDDQAVITLIKERSQDDI